MTDPRRLAHDWFDEPLPSGVSLGEGTWLYSSYAFLHDQSEGNVSTGIRCGLYNGTFFDLGPEGGVRIGDLCTIVGAIFATNGAVTLGSYCFVAHEVVIGGSPWAVPGEWDEQSAPVVIGDDVWIGARVVVLAGARIGAGAIVGAGAVVGGNVVPGAIVAGNPATTVGAV